MQVEGYEVDVNKIIDTAKAAGNKILDNIGSRYIVLFG